MGVPHISAQSSCFCGVQYFGVPKSPFADSTASPTEQVGASHLWLRSSACVYRFDQSKTSGWHTWQPEWYLVGGFRLILWPQSTPAWQWSATVS